MKGCANMLSKETLQQAVEGERNAIAGYEHMKTLTEDKEHHKTLNGIIEDEHKHLRAFEELYRRKFGNSPVSHRMTEPAACIFADCIKKALEEELESYELYRDVVLENGSEQIRAPFFEAMTDENEHAIRLNMMFAKELEKRVM
jgi:rubrerythrin